MAIKMTCFIGRRVIEAFSLGSILAISPVLFTACSSEQAAPAALVREDQVSHKWCDRPILVAVNVDQSGSMKSTGGEEVTVEVLSPLINRITECGGELGVSFIRSNSTLPIQRIRFPEPPPPVAQPTQGDSEENYEFADRVAASYDLAEEQRKVREAQTEEMKPKIDEFIKRLKPEFARPFSGETDLSSGINRADIFLDENESSWAKKPLRYLILVSDAVDTKKKRRYPFKSGAVVLWVNGTADEKRLRIPKARRFENFSAAVGYLKSAKDEGGETDVIQR
jgi:hypothetical protein